MAIASRSSRPVCFVPAASNRHRRRRRDAVFGAQGDDRLPLHTTIPKGRPAKSSTVCRRWDRIQVRAERRDSLEAVRVSACAMMSGTLRGIRLLCTMRASWSSVWRSRNSPTKCSTEVLHIHVRSMWLLPRIVWCRCEQAGGGNNSNVTSPPIDCARPAAAGPLTCTGARRDSSALPRVGLRKNWSATRSVCHASHRAS